MLTDTALKGMEKRKLWKNENVSADIPVGFFFSGSVKISSWWTAGKNSQTSAEISFMSFF